MKTLPHCHDISGCVDINLPRNRCGWPRIISRIFGQKNLSMESGFGISWSLGGALAIFFYIGHFLFLWAIIICKGHISIKKWIKKECWNVALINVPMNWMRVNKRYLFHRVLLGISPTLAKLAHCRTVVENIQMDVVHVITRHITYCILQQVVRYPPSFAQYRDRKNAWVHAATGNVYDLWTIQYGWDVWFVREGLRQFKVQSASRQYAR